MIEIKIGDLLLADEQYIAHQCNCLTDSAGGIAYYIFKKWIYSDDYTKRKLSGTIDISGSIKIHGDGKHKRFIINMFSQIYPGSPRYKETLESREKLFQETLDKILEIPNLTSIAFPYKIGCGLGGGNWENYLKMLTKFSEITSAKVVIYQRDGDI